MTHHIEHVWLDQAYMKAYGNSPPWGVIGVFPTIEDVESLEEGERMGLCGAFTYTVGLTSEYDVWVPAISVEGLPVGVNVLAQIINRLAFGISSGTLRSGDSIVMPLGDGHAGVFWIGEPELNDRRRLTKMTDRNIIIPVLWSHAHGDHEGEFIVSGSVSPGEATEPIKLPTEAGTMEIHLDVTVSPHRLTLVFARGAGWFSACDCGWHPEKFGSATDATQWYADHLKEAEANG